MKKIQLPQYVEKTLKILDRAGFAAYVVGGALRDFLLGKQPKDYDVATNALPQEVCEIMRQYGIQVVENLGHNFGVVLVVVDGEAVEIGTFRSDKYGADAHRPENVVFCKTIEEDLARRDFTINAMAVNSTGEFFDPYMGREDLQAGILRTVGEARERFAEDGLRMFRACRFCAQLGFVPESQLVAAIMDEVARVRGLSLERVKLELEKILLAENVDIGFQLLVKSGLAAQSVSFRENGVARLVPVLPELKNLLDITQAKSGDNYKLWQRMLSALVFCKPELQVRWSVLLHNIAKGGSINEKGALPPAQIDTFAATLAENVLGRFRYKKKFIARIGWSLANHTKLLTFMHSDEKLINEWLKKEARSKFFHNNKDFCEAFTMLNDICLADICAVQPDGEELLLFRSMGQRVAALAAKMPFHTSNLAIKGKDVQKILPEGQVGIFLQDALLKIQEGLLSNDKKELFAYLEGWHT